MKKYIKIFSFFIIIFCSCKKDKPDSGNTNVNPDPNPASSGVLLKKFIILDPTATAPDDTIGVIEYSYDNLNRCTLITDKYYPGPDVSEIIQNYYNGNDTLMSGRIITYPGYTDSSKEIFTYSSDGTMMSDSLVSIENSSTGWLVYKYGISNNIVRSVITANSDPLDSANYYATTNNEGNIIAEKDSGYSYNSFSGGYMLRDVTDFNIVYDTKPCPFYKLYPKRLVELDYENYTEDFTPFYIGILQKNNILSETRTTLPSTTGLGPFNDSYSYTYNTNGYPATMTYTDNLDGTTYSGIYVY